MSFLHFTVNFLVYSVFLVGTPTSLVMLYLIAVYFMFYYSSENVIGLIILDSQ